MGTSRAARTGFVQTGQVRCYDTAGREVPCTGTGQDAEFCNGLPWPQERFELRAELVLDSLTGLMWSRDANFAQFPLTWQEALDFVARMNRKAVFGFSDWRLPNRCELRSLLSHQTKKPALPDPHPFVNIFLGWYWTSTSAAINPAYAWYIHMEGARMFCGRKDQYYLLWPVRGEGAGVLPATGQKSCFDSDGLEVACAGTGQNGDLRQGRAWPEPRFFLQDETVSDRLTGLRWLRKADLGGDTVSWFDALDLVRGLNCVRGFGVSRWRRPNINELKSLVDCATFGPALPGGHPLEHVREAYWSSTTSVFEPDWAWALYLHKGAVGVGYKHGSHFSAWAVCDENMT